MDADSATITEPTTPAETVSEETQDPEPDADAAAEAKAFAEGFEGTTQDEETKEQPPETPTETPATPPAEAGGAVPAAPPPEVPPVSFTKEQADRLEQTATNVDELKRLVDKHFGKIGVIEGMIRTIQGQTPAGQPVTFSDDDFAELKADFPDLTTTLVKGLNRKAETLKGTAQPSPGSRPAEPAAASLDPAKVEELVNQRVDEGIQQAETRLVSRALTKLRPNWHQITGDPTSQTPYRQWLATQPKDYQTQVLGSMDADEINESITKFETETKKPPATPGSSRTRRLQEAATPRGSGGHPPTTVAKSEEEAFREGFSEE